MGIGEATLDAYRQLRDAGELPIRVAAFVADQPALLDRWLAAGPAIDPQARFTVRGVKLYADGALGSRGAALIEPYDDDPGNLGLLVSSEDHLREVAARAIAAGFQVAIHAIGDRGNLIALDALEAAMGGPRPELRRAHRARPGDAPPGHRAAGAAGGDRLDAADPRHLRHAVGRRPRRRAPPGRRLRLAQGAGGRRPARPGQRLPGGVGRSRGSASTPRSPGRTSPANRREGGFPASGSPARRRSPASPATPPTPSSSTARWAPWRWANGPTSPSSPAIR